MYMIFTSRTLDKDLCPSPHYVFIHYNTENTLCPVYHSWKPSVNQTPKIDKIDVYYDNLQINT
jgi:hypothetical protein